MGLASDEELRAEVRRLSAQVERYREALEEIWDEYLDNCDGEPATGAAGTAGRALGRMP